MCGKLGAFDLYAPAWGGCWYLILTQNGSARLAKIDKDKPQAQTCQNRVSESTENWDKTRIFYW
jgi:hypothetical protein